MSTIKPRFWRVTSPAVCALRARGGFVVLPPAASPAATPLSWMVSRRGIVSALVAAVMALVLVPAVTTPVSADEGDTVVRIAARSVAGERVEFALQQHGTDGTWGERMLPRQRLFPVATAVGRWLVSTPLDTDGHSVRIVARHVDNGRVEFALQQRLTDGTWGERLLPRQRFFPVATAVGRWLVSTPLDLSGTPADTAAPGDDAAETCASFFLADSEQRYVDKMCAGAADAPNTIRFFNCGIWDADVPGWDRWFISIFFELLMTPPVDLQVGTRIEFHSTCDRPRAHLVLTVTDMLPAHREWIRACRQIHYPIFQNPEGRGLSRPYTSGEVETRVKPLPDGRHRLTDLSSFTHGLGECLP